MKFATDKRTVMTLDAGGTNLVFTAIQGNEKVVDEITLPTYADNLDKCIASIMDGFSEVMSKLRSKPVAISFAFPGPADYPNGIIGDLPNLPAFRGGVALGPMLEEKFKLPVFINNDGDLYAYGEAIAGFLPLINKRLEEAGSTKRYRNLLGLTFGTGFGAGIVHDGKLFLGDNSDAGEIWLLRDKLNYKANVEEHVSILGLRNAFAREAKINLEEVPSPKDIYEICIGKKEGNKGAAEKAFNEFAEAAGDAIANAITLIDGLVVIGGGLSGAADVFLPRLVAEMNSNFTRSDGTQFRRLSQKVYNLEDEQQFADFARGKTKEITIYGSNKEIKYDYEKRTGVGISKIGTSMAISIGAYAFALSKLDK